MQPRLPLACTRPFPMPSPVPRRSLQDEIHRKHEGGSALHMMCWMNFWCGLFYIPVLFGLTDTGREVLAFCFEYPEVRRPYCALRWGRG